MLVSYITYSNDAFTDDIIPLRREVFVNELRSQESVLTDEFDKKAEHVGIYEGDTIIACGRVNIMSGVARIGCLAVKKDYRRQGLGGVLLDELMRIGGKRRKIEVAARITAEPFYKKMGFMRTGDPYVENGVKTVGMRYGNK